MLPVKFKSSFFCYMRTSKNKNVHNVIGAHYTASVNDGRTATEEGMREE